MYFRRNTFTGQDSLSFTHQKSSLKILGTPGVRGLSRRFQAFSALRYQFITVLSLGLGNLALSGPSVAPICIIHRSCHRDKPCELNSAWSLEQWDELEQRQAERARKIQERKDKPPSASPVPGSTSLRPLVIMEQPGVSTLVRQAVTVAMERLSERMALMESTVGVVRRRMKKPGSHCQHHRTAAEHRGHPPSTVGVLHLQWKFSGASGSTVREAVVIQWGAVETAAAAVTATAAVVGAVEGAMGRAVRSIRGAENAIQALSAMTPVNGAVDGAVSTVNGAVNGAMITINGAVKWAMNAFKWAVNGAISTVHRAMNTAKGAVDNGNIATSTMSGVRKGAVIVGNGAAAVTWNLWILHPHTVNTVGIVTVVIHQNTAAVHKSWGSLWLWGLSTFQPPCPQLPVSGAQHGTAQSP